MLAICYWSINVQIHCFAQIFKSCESMQEWGFLIDEESPSYSFHYRLLLLAVDCAFVCWISAPLNEFQQEQDKRRAK